MRVAHQVTTIIAEELVPNKIQWRRHVSAAIHIRKKLPVIVDQKCVDSILLTDEPEFLHRTRAHFVDFCDHSFRRAGSLAASAADRGEKVTRLMTSPTM